MLSNQSAHYVPYIEYLEKWFYFQALQFIQSTAILLRYVC